MQDSLYEQSLRRSGVKGTTSEQPSQQLYEEFSRAYKELAQRVGPVFWYGRVYLEQAGQSESSVTFKLVWYPEPVLPAELALEG